MFRKSLIALTAAAALSLGMAANAQAKTNIDVHLGFGGFGGYGGYGGGYDPGYGYYDEDCGWQWVKYKKWNKWHTKFIIKKKKVWTCY